MLSTVVTVQVAQTQDLPVTCVDLDGTLIAGDVFWESVLRLCKTAPMRALLLPVWLLRGKAYTKHRVAQEVQLQAASLPYRREVLDFLEQSRTQGRVLALATAADERVAQAVASHLKIFSHVIASNGIDNVSSSRKAARLESLFGQGRFEYIGNDWADVPAWLASGSAVSVAAPRRLLRSMARRACAVRVLVPRAAFLGAVFRALRPHQWAKNLLVFAPLASSHTLFQANTLVAAGMAFVAFCLCASSAYVLNDLIDIDVDRLHPRKKTRPFAAGHLSIPFGLGLAASLLASGMAVAALVSLPAVGILAFYLVLTFTYSWWLKREPVADVFLLAGLYVLRVVAGGIAASIFLTTWLLVFALFLFLSLAFVKRYTELAGVGRTPGRGYAADDRLWMHGVGISSGYMATLVLALYVTAPDVTALYRAPKILLVLCPVLMFWITRMWFKAGRGLLHDDPVVDALKDPVGYLCAAVGLLALLLAL
jgi:4-hydroxybenzoate polyprenyltransferase